MKTILILGATSGIGEAVAYRFAKEGYLLLLTARQTDLLSDMIRDLQTRFASIAHAFSFDALTFGEHKIFYNSLPIKPDVVVCVFGYLGNHLETRSKFDESFKTIQTNYTGAISILDIIAKDFEQRRKGIIIGISSIAGERGRKSNYHYGSAKAGFTAYLSGLRQRLYSSGVHVLTVKPGFVKTRMTEGMKLPPSLTNSPEKSADDIYRAFTKRKNVVYTPHIWRYIMFIIRMIPENIFKKLNL
ncbi:MAG: SDR family oxidoreductase [Bacteroidia bacterium]|nr:SDR family oxidoreductase [Bacteroidia bacterium]